ncbi:MAG TPA: DUF4304 domain-containing protein [Anaerolineales bacterium]|nr:DUF4304 domain-containing protein [Anaerolineales bacterium]
MTKDQIVKQLEQSISKELLPLGFKKQGKTWYHDVDECISLLNLQKSEWGAQFYLNLGVFVKQLDPRISTPKEHQCHLRLRLSDLVPNKAEFEQYLDFENEIADEQRIHEILKGLRSYAVPWLKAVESLEGIKTTILEGKGSAAVSLRLKTLLGIE